MEPVLRSSFNVADAARKLFSKSVVSECHKMVEEQKPALFSVLRDKYGANNHLRNGRNKAFIVPTHLKPSNYSSWPSIFSIDPDNPTPSHPACIRPADAIAYILDTYSSAHKTYCKKLCPADDLCTDGSCRNCLRCSQWFLTYKLWDEYLGKEVRDKVKSFFSDYYIPTFIHLISREVSPTYSFIFPSFLNL